MLEELKKRSCNKKREKNRKEINNNKIDILTNKSKPTL